MPYSFLSRFFVLFITLTCVASVLPQIATAQINARSAILCNMNTGKILYEQDADVSIPPASLTKVLSMFMALQHVQQGHATLKSPVLVSEEAAGTWGSRMELRANETLSLDTLLMGMAVSSGNDASTAVAEFVGGTEEAFVNKMNITAAALGMSSSNFCNPHGLPAPEQKTTARDMLRLSVAYLSQYPEALRFHNTRYIKHNGVVTYNKNPLLGQYPGADGLKTGWIRASGHNIISTVQRGNVRLVAVILGAPNSSARAQELYRLMEAGFKQVADNTTTVAAVLPTVSVKDCNIALDATVKEAYATLAPELKGHIPYRYKRGYGRAYKGSRNYARANGYRYYKKAYMRQFKNARLNKGKVQAHSRTARTSG